MVHRSEKSERKQNRKQPIFEVVGVVKNCVPDTFL